MDNPVNQPEVLTRREEILKAAKEALDTDASPENKAHRDLACAESVSHILNSVIPHFPKGVLSTAELEHFLDYSPDFVPTKIPKPGCVIVSPRNATQHGHAGLFLTADRIASNDSEDGLWKDNYSLDEWAKEMRGERGLHIFLFEAV